MSGRPVPLPPPVPDRFHELVKRLDMAERRVVVVSGPPGCGKSSLIERWLIAHPDACRVGLNRRDNHPRTLARTIIASLGPNAAEEDTADVEDLIRFARDALDACSEDGRRYLVLEGTEFVIAGEARQLLAELVESSPRNLRWLVATRHRCVPWLTGSDADRGVVPTICADDLRMTDSQVEAELGYPAPELAGWAVGVRTYAALGPTAGEVALRDYVHSEVMQQVTTELRSVLHAVAVAGAVEPALALGLTENPACGRLLATFASTTQLAEMSPSGLFLLHPFLERYLCSELRAQDWTRFVEVTERHAAWLARKGQLREAVRAYASLDQYDEAASLVLRDWQPAVLSGRCEDVLAALDAIPDHKITADAKLCLVRAMANLAAGDHVQWRRWSDVARVQGESRTIVEPATTLEDALAASGRLTQALLGEDLTPLPLGSALNGIWLAIDHVAVGLDLLRVGRERDARLRFRAAEVSSRASGDQLALVHALAGSALADARSGLAAAECAAREAITAAERLCPASRWVVANAHLALAELSASRGEKVAAAADARAALEVLRSTAAGLDSSTRTRAEHLLTVGEARLHTSRRPPTLSDREHRILKALSGPLTLREIAAELYVSHNTIKTQVRSIFRKLEVHDRAAAVAAARSQSLVSG